MLVILKVVFEANNHPCVVAYYGGDGTATVSSILDKSFFCKLFRETEAKDKIIGIIAAK